MSMQCGTWDRHQSHHRHHVEVGNERCEDSWLHSRQNRFSSIRSKRQSCLAFVFLLRHVCQQSIYSNCGARYRVPNQHACCRNLQYVAMWDGAFWIHPWKGLLLLDTEELKADESSWFPHHHVRLPPRIRAEDHNRSECTDNATSQKDGDQRV